MPHTCGKWNEAESGQQHTHIHIYNPGLYIQVCDGVTRGKRCYLYELGVSSPRAPRTLKIHALEKMIVPTCSENWNTCPDE